jgi:uncharacterized protein YjbJ (UPF0337 family)
MRTAPVVDVKEAEAGCFEPDQDNSRHFRGHVGWHGGMKRALDRGRGNLAPRIEETETMSDRSGDRDQIEGGVNQLKGEAKQAWGDVTGDDQMKAEGMADEMKGRAQRAMGDVKNAAEDLKDDIADHMPR